MTATVTRLDRLHAMRAARTAALRALPVTVCPYRTDGDGRQRVLARVFVREYLRHQPPADDLIDYSR
ncbi:hypothetical protein Val02_69100 [Virgisporangium aliadipatigenens]|uniref:Uncharacterized protein n=1 Tax=Virgisporangium aliadipatigenens TaxID=741659 RepID=A0A8J3YQX0_9ACTN|nr:hypothetical protein [Virgisporangium aliadipatigenens]GIJ50024.1 hypothetical protein Val02_69100 [Virgisporangium aliadipatigenens]